METGPTAMDRFMATLSEVFELPLYLATLAVQATTAGAARWLLAVVTWTLVGLIILHNPVVPVPLGSRTAWVSVETATVVLFWLLARRTRVRW